MGSDFTAGAHDQSPTPAPLPPSLYIGPLPAAYWVNSGQIAFGATMLVLRHTVWPGRRADPAADHPDGAPPAAAHPATRS